MNVIQEYNVFKVSNFLFDFSGNARSGVLSGNADSKMFAIGERLPGIPYVMKCENISHRNVSDLSRAIQDLIGSEYKTCLETIRKCENGDCSTHKNLHYLGKYPRTFDMSYNLSNPAHVDNGDISSGVSLWLRKNIQAPEGVRDNWWFVFPNLKTMESHKGIAIKLSHGVCIEWDGRIIKHCSSIPKVPPNDSFIGAFFSAKQKFT